MTDYEKSQIETIIPTKISVEIEVGLFASRTHQKGVITLPRTLILYPHAENVNTVLFEAIGRLAKELGLQKQGEVWHHDNAWRRYEDCAKGEKDCPAEEETFPAAPDLDDLD